VPSPRTYETDDNDANHKQQQPGLHCNSRKAILVMLFHSNAWDGGDWIRLTIQPGSKETPGRLRNPAAPIRTGPVLRLR
jgi:hypothetical protein